MSDSLDIRKFNPTIPKSEVDRLWRKLQDTRLPEHPIVPDAGDDYGPPLEWVHKLHRKWLNEFNWDDAQNRINSWGHYTTQIENKSIHFIHEPAKTGKEGAIPLLLVHGWPGTFFEFSRIINLLSNPEHGEQAYHVVLPSLPGFTWSSAPGRDWTLQDTARIFDKLMRGLGYNEYVTQGGDWGHFVVRELGAKYGESCKAIHTNMCPAVPDAPREEWTDREVVAQAKIEWFLSGHIGYGQEMGTRPQTIGIAIFDSPLGVMMWMGEKYHELVDPKYHDLEDKGFVDDICTTLCLYLFTGPSILTSAMVYASNISHDQYPHFVRNPDNFIKTPFGFTSYLFDGAPVSQRACATTEYNHGGHFPAMEGAEEFVADLRECFAELLQVESKA
uniref:PesI n=1 Tax=Pestalotiopsis humus TaxID=1562279 RepID=A0A6M4EK22_9PEZI|nr:PesI [Pestalotiopsis humus]